MSDAPAPDASSEQPPARFGTPVIACLLVLVALVAGSLLLGGGSADDGSAAEATAAEQAREEARQTSPEHVALVSRRVEEIRGMRFKRPVRVEVLAPEEVEAFARRELAREQSRDQLEAAEEGAKLLGQLEPGDDLDRLSDAIYGEQVAGFYDPRGGRLVLVRGSGVDDLTLAHELTHALDDQHFDLDALAGRPGEKDDDATAGETALTEGTAMRVMTQYLERHPDALSLGDALGSLGGLGDARPLPPALMRSLLFSYTGGERFVDALVATSGDWSLVDNALRHRPPVSTAEILDAHRWLRVERPLPVHVDPGALLGDEWRRVAGSTSGEWDLGELLRGTAGPGEARRLASAWTGGRYELWRSGPLPAADCDAPCRERDVLVFAYRLDDPADARAVATELAAWVVDEHDGVREADGVWRLPGDAGAAVAVRGDAVVITMAPTPELATRLARQG